MHFLSFVTEFDAVTPKAFHDKAQGREAYPGPELPTKQKTLKGFDKGVRHNAPVVGTDLFTYCVLDETPSPFLADNQIREQYGIEVDERYVWDCASRRL